MRRGWLRDTQETRIAFSIGFSLLGGLDCLEAVIRVGEPGSMYDFSTAPSARQSGHRHRSEERRGGLPANHPVKPDADRARVPGVADGADVTCDEGERWSRSCIGGLDLQSSGIVRLPHSSRDVHPTTVERPLDIPISCPALSVGWDPHREGRACDRRVRLRRWSMPCPDGTESRVATSEMPLPEADSVMCCGAAKCGPAKLVSGGRRVIGTTCTS